MQTSPVPGLRVEVFPAYGSASVTATLPISSTLQPARETTAPNVSYPASTSSDLFTLAGTSSYFGLRFSGASVCTMPGDASLFP